MPKPTTRKGLKNRWRNDGAADVRIPLKRWARLQCTSRSDLHHLALTWLGHKRKRSR